MKEYTILALLSVVVTLAVDSISGIKLMRRRVYYIFLAVIFVLMFFVNGYLTEHIVRYDIRFFSGIRLGTIPVEDFLFGFSMITLTNIFFEIFKRKKIEDA